MVYLTKIDASRNMARFYALDLQPTLFGEWALVKEWGRIGRAGQSRSVVYAGQEAAATALERELERRCKRLYQPPANARP
jgi:predicted DNA-binding WGR domain protein